MVSDKLAIHNNNTVHPSGTHKNIFCHTAQQLLLVDLYDASYCASNYVRM